MLLRRPRRYIALAIVVSLVSLPNLSFSQTTRSVENQISSKSGLIAGLADKLKARENQLSALTEQIAVKETELIQLRFDLTAFKDKISLLEAQSFEKPGQIDELNAVVKVFESTVQNNQTELVALREKEASLKALETRFSVQESLIDGLNAKIQEQDGRAIELQAKLDATKNDLGSAGGKIGTMEQNLGTFDSTVRDLKAELDQAIYQTREREAEIGRLKSDVVKAKSTHRSNQQAIDDLQFQRIILGGLLALALIGMLYSFKRRR